MQFLAARYRGRVDAYEVWNEPNHTEFWPTGPNAAAYAGLLRAAYPAIKQGDAGADVLFAGPSGNDYRYVEQAFDAVPDLGNYFDVMGAHPYSIADPEMVWRDSSGRIARDSFAGYRELRASLLAHVVDKPVWFTEFGWATSSYMGVTPRMQADYLRRAFEFVESDSYVQVACWYNLRNNWWQRDADTWQAQLGLIKSNFRGKRAFGAFRRYARSQRR
jgi:hypothetical protein